MSLKNKPVRNGSSPASFERRKRDKTGHLLNGLVADLERRTQVAFETNNNNFHVESIQGIHRLLLQIQKLERPFVNQQPKLEVSARLKLLQDWLEHQSVQVRFSACIACLYGVGGETSEKSTQLPKKFFLYWIGLKEETGLRER